ncbi:hypothetical protein L7F22_005626 [Adiantum nelumboides]|nr:hypothetical protein [Adiantum nelumboides]
MKLGNNVVFHLQWSKGKDAQEFLDNLEIACFVTGRNDDATRLCVFPFLMKVKAKAWFNTLLPANRGDWVGLRVLFQANFGGGGETSESLWGKVCELSQGSLFEYNVYDLQFVELWERWVASLRLGEAAPDFLKMDRFMAGLCSLLRDKKDDESEISQSATFGSCPLAPEEEVGNVELQFDPKEERVEVSKETFDAGLTLASLADATIGCKQESPNKEETLPPNCAPSFVMAGNSHYILLTDIMTELNIREDYCLAAIVNFCESDMGFLDDGVDQHLIANTAVHDSQFTLGWQLIKIHSMKRSPKSQICQQMSSLNRTTKQLSLENMGRHVAPRAQAMNSQSIHLWGRSMLEMDENQMVLVYDDSFLRRARGSWQGLVTGVQGKDAGVPTTKRISKWIMELQEFQYSFKVEDSVRAQLVGILTYRVHERDIKVPEVKTLPLPPPKSLPNAFTLFFDGAFRKATGKAWEGLVLHDSNGEVVMKKHVKLPDSTSNNEA